MSNSNSDNNDATPFSFAAPVTVLFVDANVNAARLVEKALRGADDATYHIEWVSSLDHALGRLARGDIEVVLAGNDLPDCDGAEVFKRLRREAPDALVLPLGGANQEGATVHPADNAITESAMDMNWLPGALHYVARRKFAQAAWRIADEALYEEKERARVTLGSIGDAVLVTDTDGNVTYLNPVAEHMTGWSCSQAIGQPLPVVFDITDSETGKQARNPALHAMAEDATVGLSANCVLHRLDGSQAGIEDSAAPVHDRHGHVTGAVIVFRDVNQSRAMTRKMAWLASHDSLTGAASRVLFEERCRQVISLASRHNRMAAMLFVDMDNFKQINDVFGHGVGDHVLKFVAESLTRGVRDTDTVCRHGGDEFLILLADVGNPEAAEQAANDLLSLFNLPLSIDGQQVQVTMSIGISLYPDDGEDMHALIQQADVAMYQAKAKDENSCGFIRHSGSRRSDHARPVIHVRSAD